MYSRRDLHSFPLAPISNHRPPSRRSNPYLCFLSPFPFCFSRFSVFLKDLARGLQRPVQSPCRKWISYEFRAPKTHLLATYQVKTFPSLVLNFSRKHFAFICQWRGRSWLGLISRLHDHQTSSNHRANIQQMHSKYTCTTCVLIAGCLLDVCSMSARCLLDVCLMYAWSCKRDLRFTNVTFRAQWAFKHFSKQNKQTKT